MCNETPAEPTARSWTDLWKQYGRPIAWVGVLAWLGIVLYDRITIAVENIGYLFGWLIGASKSPVAGTVAPLVFGLLGAVVFASIAAVFATLRMDPKSPPSFRNTLVSLLAALAIAHFASWFVYQSKVGITEGARVHEAALKDQARRRLSGSQQAD